MASNGGNPEDATSLSPSCRYILDVLERADGGLTRQELLEETELPERTLTRALNTLQNGGYILRTRKNDDLREVVAILASERAYNTLESDTSE